jgi:hypothetical protein
VIHSSNSTAGVLQDARAKGEIDEIDEIDEIEMNGKLKIVPGV